MTKSQSLHCDPQRHLGLARYTLVVDFMSDVEQHIHGQCLSKQPCYSSSSFHHALLSFFFFFLTAKTLQCLKTSPLPTCAKFSLAFFTQLNMIGIRPAIMYRDYGQELQSKQLLQLYLHEEQHDWPLFLWKAHWQPGDTTPQNFLFFGGGGKGSVRFGSSNLVPQLNKTTPDQAVLIFRKRALITQRLQNKKSWCKIASQLEFELLKLKLGFTKYSQ